MLIPDPRGCLYIYLSDPVPITPKETQKAADITLLNLKRAPMDLTITHHTEQTWAIHTKNF